MQSDSEAIASIINPNAASQAQRGFPGDRGLSIGALGYDGQWQNAINQAEAITKLLVERGWKAPGDTTAKTAMERYQLVSMLQEEIQRHDLSMSRVPDGPSAEYMAGRGRQVEAVQDAIRGDIPFDECVEMMNRLRPCY